MSKQNKRYDDDNKRVYYIDKYLPALVADLKKARDRVIVHCESLTCTHLDAMLPHLRRCTRRKITVCVFAQEPPNWERRHEPGFEELKVIEAAAARLHDFGIHVNLRDQKPGLYIIIDEDILWENPFSAVPAPESNEHGAPGSDAKPIKWRYGDPVIPGQFYSVHPLDVARFAQARVMEERYVNGRSLDEISELFQVSPEVLLAIEAGVCVEQKAKLPPDYETVIQIPLVPTWVGRRH